MSTKRPTPIQQALDQIEGLESDDQRVVIEIVHQRLVERRRAEIAENARSTLRAFREGSAQCGTIDDLRRDLAEDR